MHAMAPSSNLEPHDGQTVGMGAGAGIATAPLEPLPTTGGPGACAGGGVGGFGAGPAGAGIMNGFLHDGQRTFFPPALSGTCIDLVQCGQRITCGIGCTLHFFLFTFGVRWDIPNAKRKHGRFVGPSSNVNERWFTSRRVSVSR